MKKLLKLHSCFAWRLIESHLEESQLLTRDTLLQLSRYYNTTLCHYWDMLQCKVPEEPAFSFIWHQNGWAKKKKVSKIVSILLSKLAIVPILTHRCATVTTTVTTHF